MITNCVFQPNGEGKFVCPDCGLTVPRATIKANCRSKNKQLVTDAKPLPNFEPNINQQIVQPEIQPPSLLKRVSNFIAAATIHAIAGNPTVTEEVMKERLNICMSCPLFKKNENAIGGVCTHANCGCNVQDNLNYLNKIAWADQKCPIGKWGEINETK